MFKGVKKWKENSSPKIVGMIANIMHLTMMVLVLIVSMDGEGVFGKKESFVMNCAVLDKNFETVQVYKGLHQRYNILVQDLDIGDKYIIDNEIFLIHRIKKCQ